MASHSSTDSISLFGMTFLVLMTLKLTGFIAWSWWWVTAPLWGGLAFVAFVVFCAFMLTTGWVVGAVFFDSARRRWRRWRAR